MANPLPTSSAAARAVRRIEADAAEDTTDHLAVEEPLEIRLAGAALAITMRTPGHDDELAAGFCVTEGIVTQSGDFASVTVGGPFDEENIVDVALSDAASKTRGEQVDRASRDLYMSSSCGVCGKQSIDKLRQSFEPIVGNFTVSRGVLASLPDRMRQAQDTFDRTGGLHAAGMFTPDGELVVLREDVGRHNAVDKAIGRLALDSRLPFDPGVLMVSGRSSFEIMQKAAMAGIACVAAVSAPSSLAVDFAADAGMTLVGFLRGDRMNVYTRADRVT